MQVLSTLIDVIKFHQKTQNYGITLLSGKKNIFLSYSNLYFEALTSLAGLQQFGINPGDKLILQIDDNQQFIILFWACILGGIIPVPVSIGTIDEAWQKLINIWQVCDFPFLATSQRHFELLMKYLTTQDINHKLSDNISRRSVILEQLKKTDTISGTIPEIEATDPAFIQFSSGSTGNPKGVILTHKNVLTNIYAIIKNSGITAADSTFSWLPLTHDMGLVGFHLTGIVKNINEFIMEPAVFIRHPDDWLKKVSDSKATLLGTSHFGLKHFLTFYNKNNLKEIDLQHIRLIYIGAEPIAPSVCIQFAEELACFGLKHNTLFPVYGLAEATVAVTFPTPGREIRIQHVMSKSLAIGSKIEKTQPGISGSLNFVEVGAAVDNCQVRICSMEDAVLEAETLGQVQIKGANITTAYLNNNKATAALFTQDGWLKTGDLGFLSDGRLTITGRCKDIIFSNGLNYFSHDIEAAAEELRLTKPEKLIAVGVFDPVKEEEVLLLFIVYKKTDLDDLCKLAVQFKQQLARKIGISIRHVIPVKKIPRTTSGKKQRYILRDQYLAGEYDALIDKIDAITVQRKKIKADLQEASYIEKKLLELWQKIFHKENIHPDDNFFELGGDSLKASYLVACINKEFNIRLDLEAFFDISTINELKKYLDKQEKVTYEGIGKYEEKMHYPLSPAQKRIFVLHQINSNSTAYNIPVAIHLEQKLQKKKLNGILNTLINRHEVLHSGFKYRNGIPVQYINNTSRIEITYNTKKRKLDSGILKTQIKEFIQPFNLLDNKPLIRIHVTNLLPTGFLLLFDFHHIIADGASIMILLNDFTKLYSGNPLPISTIQYKDYIFWYIDRLKTDADILKQKQNWLALFSDTIPVLNLPTDFPRPSRKDFAGSNINFQLSESLTHELKALAKSLHVTLYMLLLAIYNVLLMKYSGQTDIIIGSPIAGRQHVETHNIFGLFMNTLVHRNRPASGKTFNCFLEEVKKNAINAYKNQEIQIEELIESLNIKRDLSRNPLFDTMFIMQNIPEQPVDFDAIKAKRYPLERKTSLVDLSLYAFEKKASIDFSFEYSTQLFKRTTIEGFINHFINIIKIVLDNFQIKIGQIYILSPEEETQILSQFNQTSTPFPEDLTIQEIFEKRVSESPDKIAVISKNNCVSYAKLNRRVNQIARTLREYGVKPGVVAGILINRSIKMLEIILAILKANGTFLPLDIDYPKERLEFMLKDSAAALVIASEKYFSKLPSGICKINIDNQSAEISGYKQLENDNTPEDIAYIMYTSGSTGTPKGVRIMHKSVINILLALEKLFPVQEEDSYLLKTSYTFDVSIVELFGWFFGKGKLVILEEQSEKSSQKLIQAVYDHKITHINFISSMFRIFMDSLDDNTKKMIDCLKYIFLVGEAVPYDVVDKYNKLNLKIDLEDLYGPTETAIYATRYPLKLLKENTNVPIGKPLSNYEILILNTDLQLQPKGLPGEIYISGVGVAKDYLNRPELTSEKFLTNIHKSGERMYRTGDLGRWLADGNIEFLGRIDHQVKIRGYRIEIEEIESVIRQHPAITDAIVIPREFFPGDKRLVAYIMTKSIIYWEDVKDFMETARQTSRRSEFRLPFKAPCRITINENLSLQTDIIDISYSSMALKQSGLPSCVNDIIGLNFTLPLTGKISINARIIGITANKINVHFESNLNKINLIRHAIDELAKSKSFLVFDFRRSEYRIPFTATGNIIKTTGDQIPCSIKDISGAGTSLFTNTDNLHLNEELTLHIDLNSSSQIKIKARIIWIEAKQMGIKFTTGDEAMILKELGKYVKHGKLTIKDLRKFLINKLPLYMIPSIFIIIDSIPRTASGKIDRKALPEPNLGIISGSAYEPPTNPLEQKLWQIWKKILENDQIGINDNFFEIGGNSLKAIQIVNEMQFNYDISIIDFFTYQTISKLAKHINYTKDKLQERISGLKADFNAYLHLHANQKKKLHRNYLQYRKKYNQSVSRLKGICKFHYKNILLTGASGFLGIHLLAELLTGTSGVIHTLIRAENAQKAEIKLSGQLTCYFTNVFFEKYRERIKIITGDISHEYLGMNINEYKLLAKNIDCIINAAAVIKHYSHFAHYKKTNVDGTRNLIKFAFHTQFKDYYHMSTIDVAAGLVKSHEPVFFSEYDQVFPRKVSNNYLRSKIAAEQIVIRARQKGLRTTIFRIGILTPPQKTGKFYEPLEKFSFFQFLYSLMTTCYIPDLKIKNMDFTYVDCAGKAITLLIAKYPGNNGIYHITNSHKISLFNLYTILKKANIHLNILPFEGFLDFLYQHYHSKQNKSEIAHILSYLRLFSGLKRTQIITATEKTEILLKKISFHWKKPRKKYIKKLILNLNRENRRPVR